MENRAFISYARTDVEIIRTLCALFDKCGIGVWIDWEDIPPSAEWMAEIRAGIEAADAFAFVMSPRSLASRVCLEELNHAIAVGKRLIPVVIEETAPDHIPEDLQKLNWIFARTPDELPDAVEQFTTTLITDLEKLRRHARILVRAREWMAGNKHESFLLRDLELREAEAWLARIDEQGPMPVALHTDYILASQQAEREEAARWKQLYEASLTRQLAAQSQLLVDQRGTALPLAALLAVEAAKRAPSLETDQALRKSLALMPIRYKGIENRLYSACFYAYECDRVAVVSEGVIEIRTIEKNELITTLDPEGAVATRRPHRHAMPVILSPDGRYLAAIVDESSIRIWHLDDGSQSVHIDCDGLKINAFGISRDASRVVVTLEDATSRLYEVANAAVVAQMQHDASMQDLSLHPDAEEMAIWNQSVAEIWEFSGPSCISKSKHMGIGYRMEYSPTGVYLALLQTRTFEINVYHVPTRKLILKENRHVDIAFDRKDRMFAIASPEWDLLVFDLPACHRRHRMQHDDSAWRVVFNPDGTRLASYSKDGTIRIWDIEREAREVARIVLEDQRIQEIRFSADGLRLLLINESHVAIYDARGFREWRLLDVSSPVFSVFAVPEKKHLLFGCRNGTWALVDFEQHNALHVIAYSEGEHAMGQQVSDLMQIGAHHVLIERATGPYQLINITNGSTDADFADLAVHQAAGCTTTGLIAAATGDSLEVVKWKNGVCARWSMPEKVKALAVVDKGGKILVLCGNGQVLSCEENAVHMLYHIPGYTRHRISFDAAGTRLAYWLNDDASSHVFIVEIATEKVLSSWVMPSRVNDLRFDASGAHVVLAMQDKSVQVWDAGAGRALALFRHEAAAQTACFTSDDEMIASGSWDGTVRVWPWQSEWLIKAACGRLDRNLSEAEWAQYIQGEPYRATCAGSL